MEIAGRASKGIDEFRRSMNIAFYNVAFNARRKLSEWVGTLQRYDATLEHWSEQRRLTTYRERLTEADYSQLPDKYLHSEQYQYMRDFRKLVIDNYSDPNDVDYLLSAAVFGEESKRFHEYVTGEVVKRESSGRDAYEHPVEVATTVISVLRSQFGVVVPVEGIAAYLLHDSVEDDGVSYVAIEANFGKRVRNIVYRMTKIKHEAFEGLDEEVAHEMTIELLLTSLRHEGTMDPDLLVILGKLFDREVNSRTFRDMKDKYRGKVLVELAEERWKRKGRETLDVYYPLAHHFGMWDLRDLIADRSLECVDPTGYENTKQLVAENPIDIGQLRVRMEDILDRYIEGRLPKHIGNLGINRQIREFNMYPRIADFRAPGLYHVYKRINDGIEELLAKVQRRELTLDEELLREKVKQIQKEALKPVMYIDVLNYEQMGKLWVTLLRYNSVTSQVDGYLTQDEINAKLAGQDEVKIDNFRIGDEDGQQVTLILRNSETSWAHTMPLSLRVQYPPTARSAEALKQTYYRHSNYLSFNHGTDIFDRNAQVLEEMGYGNFVEFSVIDGFTSGKAAFARSVLVKKDSTVLDVLFRTLRFEDLEELTEIAILNPKTGRKTIINTRLGEPMPPGTILVLSRGKTAFHYKPHPEDLFRQKYEAAERFVLHRVGEWMNRENTYYSEMEDALLLRGKTLMLEAMEESPLYQPYHGYLSEIISYFSKKLGSEFTDKIVFLGLSADATEQAIFSQELLEYISSRTLILEDLPGRFMAYAPDFNYTDIELLWEYVEEGCDGIMQCNKAVEVRNGKASTTLAGFIAVPEPEDLEPIRYSLQQYII